MWDSVVSPGRVWDGFSVTFADVATTTIIID